MDYEKINLLLKNKNEEIETENQYYYKRLDEIKEKYDNQIKEEKRKVIADICSSILKMTDFEYEQGFIQKVMMGHHFEFSSLCLQVDTSKYCYSCSENIIFFKKIGNRLQILSKAELYNVSSSVYHITDINLEDASIISKSRENLNCEEDTRHSVIFFNYKEEIRDRQDDIIYSYEKLKAIYDFIEVNRNKEKMDEKINNMLKDDKEIPAQFFGYFLKRLKQIFEKVEIIYGDDLTKYKLSCSDFYYILTLNILNDKAIVQNCFDQDGKIIL